MKLFNELPVPVGWRWRRHDEFEVEDVRLPRSEAEGAMQAEADFVELCGVGGEAFSQHCLTQSK